MSSSLKKNLTATLYLKPADWCRPNYRFLKPFSSASDWLVCNASELGKEYVYKPSGFSLRNDNIIKALYTGCFSEQTNQMCASYFLSFPIVNEH